MRKMLFFTFCLTIGGVYAQQQTHKEIKQSPVNEAEKAPNLKPTVLPNNKALWDLQFSFDATAAAGSSGQAGVIFINNEFWTSRWSNDTLYRYSSAGALLETFTISGLSGTRSMTTDGTDIYVGNASSTINVVDPTTKTVTSTIASSAGVSSRFLTYDASLDGGNGGFWTGDFNTDIVAIDMSGTMLSSIPAATHGLGGMYGAAADPTAAGGPVLWVFHQEGANTSQVTAIRTATGTSTGTTHDVFTDISATYSLNSSLAGGAFLTTEYNGSLTLICLAQGDPSNVVVVYDGVFASLEEESLNTLSVFPVPATEFVNVEFETALTEKSVAKLFDMSGKEVLAQEVESGAAAFEMNVSGLAKGVYQLTVNSNTGLMKKRVIVE